MKFWGEMTWATDIKMGGRLRQLACDNAVLTWNNFCERQAVHFDVDAAVIIGSLKYILLMLVHVRCEVGLY